MKLQACNFIKKENLAQVFSREFREISKNTFLHRIVLVAASDFMQVKTHCRVFQTLGWAFEILRENQKLGWVFEKLSRVFKNLGRVIVFKHGPFRPNQPRSFCHKETAKENDAVIKKEKWIS